MLDISSKTKTLREAEAKGIVKLRKETVVRIKQNTVPKGNVLELARIAGIFAAKRTSELIPYCHPVPLDFISLEFNLREEEIEIWSKVKAIWETGVEMEALVAVSLAALTIYDMLKPIDNTLEISSIGLVSKKGGKSDFEESFEEAMKTAVLVISDSTFSGQREDKAGKIILEWLRRKAAEVVGYKILPDDQKLIQEELLELSDKNKIDLILTTGGTGLGPKDVTVEATKEIIQREVPGISETLRQYGQSRTPFAMLSRGVVGIRGRTLIINLPGSSKGTEESLQALDLGLFHIFKMMRGEGHKER